MGSVTELFLLLGILALIECLRWVAPGTVGLRSLVPGRWDVVRPILPGVKWTRAFVPVAPWPPLGALFVGDELPLRLAPDGLLIVARAADGWTSVSPQDRLLSWDETKRLQLEGHELRLDGAVVTTFGTRRLATSIRLLLEEMRKSPKPEKRLEAFLDARFDHEEIRRRIAAWRKAAAPLVVASNLLWLLLLGSLVIIAVPLRVNLTILVVELLLLWGWTALLAEWTLRRALPLESRPSRGRRLVSLLSPLGLVRAHDELRVEVLGDFDPLAIALVLLPADRFKPFARRTLAELVNPLSPPQPAASEEARRLDEWWRRRLEGRLRKLLESTGTSPAALLDTPPPLDGGGRTWCPRCLATYGAQSGECSACPGVALRAFAAPSAG